MFFPVTKIFVQCFLLNFFNGLINIIIPANKNEYYHTNHSAGR